MDWVAATTSDNGEASSGEDNQVEDGVDSLNSPGGLDKVASGVDSSQEAGLRDLSSQVDIHLSREDSQEGGPHSKEVDSQVDGPHSREVEATLPREEAVDGPRVQVVVAKVPLPRDLPQVQVTSQSL